MPTPTFARASVANFEAADHPSSFLPPAFHLPPSTSYAIYILASSPFRFGAYAMCSPIQHEERQPCDLTQTLALGHAGRFAKERKKSKAKQSASVVALQSSQQSESVASGHSCWTRRRADCSAERRFLCFSPIRALFLPCPWPGFRDPLSQTKGPSERFRMLAHSQSRVLPLTVRSVRLRGRCGCPKSGRWKGGPKVVDEGSPKSAASSVNQVIRFRARV